MFGLLGIVISAILKYTGMTFNFSRQKKKKIMENGKPPISKYSRDSTEFIKSNPY